MNWNAIVESLNTKGYAIIPQVLSKSECEHLCGFYEEDQLFRSVISMERYRFGKGEYKYFSYPLPPSIQALRERLFSTAVKIGE